MGQDLEVVRSLAGKLEADAALLAEALVNVSDQVDERDRAVPDQRLGILIVPEKCHPKRDLVGEREGVLGLLAHSDGGRPVVEAGDDFAEFLDLGCRSLRLARLEVRVVEGVMADVGDRLGGTFCENRRRSRSSSLAPSGLARAAWRIAYSTSLAAIAIDTQKRATRSSGAKTSGTERSAMPCSVVRLAGSSVGRPPVEAPRNAVPRKSDPGGESAAGRYPAGMSCSRPELCCDARGQGGGGLGGG